MIYGLLEAAAARRQLAHGLSGVVALPHSAQVSRGGRAVLLHQLLLYCTFFVTFTGARSSPAPEVHLAGAEEQLLVLGVVPELFPVPVFHGLLAAGVVVLAHVEVVELVLVAALAVLRLVELRAVVHKIKIHVAHLDLVPNFFFELGHFAIVPPSLLQVLVRHQAVVILILFLIILPGTAVGTEFHWQHADLRVGRVIVNPKPFLRVDHRAVGTLSLLRLHRVKRALRVVRIKI